MTDRYIDFRSHQVRAALDGRLSQTRRVLKPRLVTMLKDEPEKWGKFLRHFSEAYQENLYVGEWLDGTKSIQSLPYAPGDRLWVRERWSGAWQWRDMKPSDRARTSCPSALQAWYWADGSPEYGDWEKPRPSIHMPRWASRLTLTVTDVRVQRVQEITGRDVVAEGIRCDGCLSCGTNACRDGGCFEAKALFRDLWNSLHGPDAWGANPWVVALTFDVHRCNIDQMEKGHDQ